MARLVNLALAWSLATVAAVVGPSTVANVEPPTSAGEHDAAGQDPAAAALAFAVEHHPELVPLLERLRTEAPAEFAAAVADLDRARERLAKLRDRQPERYEAALADWKLSSRIRLVLARLSTSPSAAAERELRELIRLRAEARLAPLRAERERITARLEKIDAQLTAFDRDPEAAITGEYEGLRSKALKEAGRPRPGKRPVDRPASKPDATPAAPQPASATP